MSSKRRNPLHAHTRMKALPSGPWEHMYAKRYLNSPKVVWWLYLSALCKIQAWTHPQSNSLIFVQMILHCHLSFKNGVLALVCQVNLNVLQNRTLVQFSFQEKLRNPTTATFSALTRPLHQTILFLSSSFDRANKNEGISTSLVLYNSSKLMSFYFCTTASLAQISFSIMQGSFINKKDESWIFPFCTLIILRPVFVAFCCNLVLWKIFHFQFCRFSSLFNIRFNLESTRDYFHRPISPQRCNSH